MNSRTWKAALLLVFMTLAYPVSGWGAQCEHVVRSGDSLSGISSAKLGDSARWREIAELNGISDPGRIAVGMKLALPCPPSVGSSVTANRSMRPFDPDARLAWLEANPRYAARACRIAGKRAIPIVGDATMPAEGDAFGCKGSCQALGDLSRAAAPNSTACFLGRADACDNIVDALKRHALSDGISYSGNRNKDSGQFEDTRLEVNIALPYLVGGYHFAKRRGRVEAGDAEVIDPWLKERVGFYNTYRRYRQDNHLSQAAVVNAITGLAIEDSGFIRRAERQYEAAIRGMRRDGSLPAETERGASAVYYSAFEMNFLMALSEYLAMAGSPVFGSRDSNAGIHKAMSYLLDIMEDWNGVMRYAKTDNTAHHDNYREQVYPYPYLMLAGFELYRQRYPDHPNSLRMASLELDPRTCGVPRNRSTLNGQCASSGDRVRLSELLEADVGEYHMGGMANLYCMFGQP